MLKRQAKCIPQYDAPNVVLLRQRLTSHHRAMLSRWLEAGRCMGLCDASAYPPGPGRIEPDYVLVWVRENADPAYKIVPEGMDWRVIDCIRNENLACRPSFEAALNYIRPVLKLTAAA